MKNRLRTFLHKHEPLLVGIGGLVLVLFAVVQIGYVQAQPQSAAVFVQPSVGAPGNNPDLYIDTSADVGTLDGQLQIDTSGITIPSGLTDRNIVENYEDVDVVGAAVFSTFADLFNNSLGVRDDFWVDSFVGGMPGQIIVFDNSVSSIPNPFPVPNTVNDHPGITHQYVAHGSAGVEELLCADAAGYIQLCNSGGASNYDAFTCNGGSQTWTGPGSALQGDVLCASGVTYNSGDGLAINCDLVYPDQAPPSGTLCSNNKCNVPTGNSLPAGAICEDGSLTSVGSGDPTVQMGG